MGKARDGAEAAWGQVLSGDSWERHEPALHLVLWSWGSLLLPGQSLLSLGLVGGHRRKGGQETKGYFIPGLLVIA